MRTTSSSLLCYAQTRCNSSCFITCSLSIPFLLYRVVHSRLDALRSGQASFLPNPAGNPRAPQSSANIRSPQAAPSRRLRAAARPCRAYEFATKHAVLTCVYELQRVTTSYTRVLNELHTSSYKFSLFMLCTLQSSSLLCYAQTRFEQLVVMYD